MLTKQQLSVTVQRQTGETNFFLVAFQSFQLNKLQQDTSLSPVAIHAESVPGFFCSALYFLQKRIITGKGYIVHANS